MSVPRRRMSRDVDGPRFFEEPAYDPYISHHRGRPETYRPRHASHDPYETRNDRRGRGSSYDPRYDRRDHPAAYEPRRGRSEARPAHDPDLYRRHDRPHRDHGHDYPPRTRDTQHSRYNDFEDDYRPAQSRPKSHSRGRLREASADRSRHHSNGSKPARHQSMPNNKSTGSRPKSHSNNEHKVLQMAARTALQVGAQAAFRVRNEPGPWFGEKGTKVATAAIGAALVDSFMGHKHANMKGGIRHLAMRQAADFALGKAVVQPVAAREGTKKH